VKFFKRILLVISVLILLLAVAGVTPLSNLNTDEKIERNFLNGLPGVNEQILVVKIDDTRAAHPQIGLEYADVVYVEQVEGGLTRLAAVYSSQLPPLIGPVRSAEFLILSYWLNTGELDLHTAVRRRRCDQLSQRLI